MIKMKRKNISISMTASEIRMLNDFREMLSEENPRINFTDAVNYCIWNYLKNNEKFNQFVLDKEK